MNEKIDKQLLESLVSLATVIEARDAYTGGHTWRVSQYCFLLGQKIGLSLRELFLLELGGLVHDLGKVAIPDAILNKPGQLTDEEYAAMKNHVELGTKLIKTHPLSSLVEFAVGHHHERADGKGYPTKLKNGEMPIISRIISIADAFDAMTSDRPYRRRMELSKVRKILVDNAGTQFDKSLTYSFIEMLDDGHFETILGHAGENRKMCDCDYCGQVVAPPSDIKDGSIISCPICRAKYEFNQREEGNVLRATGEMDVPYLPQVDKETIDVFINKMSEYFK